MDIPTHYLVRGDFSVYELVDKQNVSNIFIEKWPMLAHYCRRIETELVERRLPADLYVGFQQFQRVRPVQGRYRQLADLGASVYLFGGLSSNAPQIDGARYVALRPEDQLMREWFLVASHPDYQRALIAREVSPPGLPHDERTFEGVLTSDALEIAWIAERIRGIAEEVAR